MDNEVHVKNVPHGLSGDWIKHEIGAVPEVVAQRWDSGYPPLSAAPDEFAEHEAAYQEGHLVTLPLVYPADFVLGRTINIALPSHLDPAVPILAVCKGFTQRISQLVCFFHS